MNTKTKFDHAEALKMFHGGAEPVDIARRFNVDRSTVYQMLKSKATEAFASWRAAKPSRGRQAAPKVKTVDPAAPDLFSAIGGEKRPVKAVSKQPRKQVVTPPAAAVEADTTPTPSINIPSSPEQGTPDMQTAQFELIGPDEAKAILTANTANRPLSEATVERYVADMKAGAWKINGASVVLSRTGRLLDGQHRLHAIARAGVKINILVVHDAEEEVFDTIDNGKTRSASDIMALQGARHAPMLTSSGRLIHNYASRLSLLTTVPRVPLTEFLTANPSIQKTVDLVAGYKKIRLPKAPLTAVLHLGNIAGEYDTQVLEFLEALNTGAGLERNDPRLTLREWETAERARARGQVKQPQAFGATARAWNAYVTNKPLGTIRGIENPTLNNLLINGFTRNNLVFPRNAAPAAPMDTATMASRLEGVKTGHFKPVDATVV